MPLFEDTKILELGAGAAGPLATRYFAEHGARVIRIESARRPDFLRALFRAPAEAGGLDASPMFVALNADKQSVRLDLSRPEARALARRLVDWADVVLENFAPGVMARWQLDWETLREARPDLVMVSGCLFGQTGPQRGYPGFGGQGSAIAGFNHLTGWPDREAHGPYGTITDSLSPRYVALAIAAALLERRRTGRGRFVDVSQIECGVYSLSEMIVRESAGAESPTRCGNRDPVAAPHGVFPVRGEDRWVAIAVFDDRQWEALVVAMGSPEWARAPHLAALAERRSHQDELEARLAAWTRGQDGPELMRRLQAAGVEAGLVQDVEDLERDPQLAHRGHFVRAPHPHLGEVPLERCGFRLSACPGEVRRPGPDLGADDEAVLGGILGLSAEEIDGLREAGVVA